MNILLVGGTWIDTSMEPKQPLTRLQSGVVNIVNQTLLAAGHKVTMFNGGDYNELNSILQFCDVYDTVLWWAHVPDNDLPKIRNVKDIAPNVMLVTSKRNDGDYYNFMQLTQHALARKANLTFEFKLVEKPTQSTLENLFNIRVFDPLGCVWYDGTNIPEAITAAVARLDYLRSITRQKTIQSTTDKNLVLAWYFDRFKQDMTPSEKSVATPNESEFINIVRKYAERFYEIMNPGKDIRRFLGNASMKPMPPQVGRCSRGMPSFKAGNYVFVSQRNIDKQFIDLNHFVPCYMENDKLYYCGENKPSVDTPIQMRLYNALPNIRYIIHSHCYIEGAPFTSTSIPCGAIEEVDEVLKLIMSEYGSINCDRYVLNLKGHGSLLMAANTDLLSDINYIGRNLPENMCSEIEISDTKIENPIELPLWTVPISWTMLGTIKISAPTLGEAIKLAYGHNTPTSDGTYIDESIEPFYGREGIDIVRREYNHGMPDMEAPNGKN